MVELANSGKCQQALRKSPLSSGFLCPCLLAVRVLQDDSLAGIALLHWQRTQLKGVRILGPEPFPVTGLTPLQWKGSGFRHPEIRGGSVETEVLEEERPAQQLRAGKLSHSR